MKTFFKRALTAPYTFLPVNAARRVVQQATIDTQANLNSKQLLVDISEIFRHDARTGIQRVVRGILLQLFNNPPEGYVVSPVFATITNGYRYADVSPKLLYSDKSICKQNNPVTVCNGDLFLGLDLAAHILPRHQGELASWKRHGVRLVFFVYDILPVTHPQWFSPNLRKAFHRWLRTLAVHADDLVCISSSVKFELSNWLSCRYKMKDETIRLHTIPLGADIEATMPSSGLTSHQKSFLTQENMIFVLMVGTLEPRKGYGQVLDAFELLWRQGHDIKLVIAGRPGWKTELLQERLRSHTELNRRIFWFVDASDEFLQALYADTSGVIVASEAEGFGLPLVEAMRYGKQLLVRDIPVFREISGKNITFFTHTSQEQFATVVITWHTKVKKMGEKDNEQVVPAWSDTLTALNNILNSQPSNINFKTKI